MGPHNSCTTEGAPFSPALFHAYNRGASCPGLLSGSQRVSARCEPEAMAMIGEVPSAGEHRRQKAKSGCAADQKHDQQLYLTASRGSTLRWSGRSPSGQCHQTVPAIGLTPHDRRQRDRSGCGSGGVNRPGFGLQVVIRGKPMHHRHRLAPPANPPAPSGAGRCGPGPRSRRPAAPSALSCRSRPSPPLRCGIPESDRP